MGEPMHMIELRLPDYLVEKIKDAVNQERVATPGYSLDEFYNSALTTALKRRGTKNGEYLLQFEARETLSEMVERQAAARYYPNTVEACQDELTRLLARQSERVPSEGAEQ